MSYLNRDGLEALALRECIKQLTAENSRLRAEAQAIIDSENEADAERYRHLRMFLTTKDLSIILERRPETDEEGDDVDAYLDKNIKENYGVDNA